MLVLLCKQAGVIPPPPGISLPPRSGLTLVLTPRSAGGLNIVPI